MKKKRFAAMLLSVLILVGSCAGTWAGEPVKYIDAFWDGGKVVFSEKEVTEYNTAGSGTWTDGWYVAKSSVTVTTRITVSGTVNLILCDGVTFSAKDGIEVSDMNTLNIYAQSQGTGTLNARTSLLDYLSNSYNAAIGGSNRQACGTITINGGNINAVPSINSKGGAGIGGGCYGGGGTITINGGNVTATGATYHGSNYYGGAGIGGGYYGNGGAITINGGTVNASSGYFAAGIGGGYEGAGGVVTINGGNITTLFNIEGEGWTSSGIGAGSIGKGRTTVTINGGIVDAAAGIRGCSGGRSRITINGGTVNAHIDGNSKDGSDITINGGNVTATSNKRYAGIDSSCLDYSVNSTITINGGTVNAIGGTDYYGLGCAGIIAGVNSTIKINGGSVTAKGSYGEPGIDSGKNSTVEINGGTVMAIGGNGGAGIGSGKNESCGTVKITGGHVTATGGYEGAGIGSGFGGAGGNVEITGGNVTATGGNGGMTFGIGAGLDNDDNGTLTLGLHVQLFGGTSPNPTSIIEQLNGDYARYRYMTAEKITPPEISGNFANGVVRAEYTSEITISGDTAPYTWTKTEGTIPNGLALTSSDVKAVLSGTPSKAGTFKFTLKITDKNNISVTKSFTVKITQTKISSTFTAECAVKKSYSVSIKASSGTAPYTWTKTKGTLPKGLKLTYAGTNAKLSGTPTKAGTYTFTLTATDKNGVPATKSFTVKITEPIISGTFANGVIKAAYSKAVTVSGGTANYTWKNTGTLPTGLKITYSGAKATLSGTPTKAGTYTFTLTATDKNKAAVTKSFTVKITQPTIAATFANGVIKAAYTSSVTVSGGTAAYTWKNSGTIPTGLKLTYSGAKATLSGTPTKAGTYTFTLTATDKNKAAVTKSFTVKITQPTIAATFANGVIKAAYSSAVTVSGGTAAYTWKNSGTIPTGLKITYSGAKATLSGTPTKAGTYTFTLTATDKNKAAVTKSFTVKITQPTIAATFANGVIKAAYSSAVTVSGGTAAYTWKNSGTIPTGLKITYSGAKATLSGTPTKAGTYTFSLTATDKNKVAVTKSFTVKITQPTIVATFANGVIKAAYSSAVTVSGGTANYTWKNSGTIPTGLKITYSGAKATLSGTPTKAGTYTFTLTATDKNKAAVTKSFTVKITQPTIAATFANGVIKAAYSSAVTVSGGTANYTWKNSGTIPTGLKLTYSGSKATLSGTPTKAGTYTFTLTVTDKNKAAVTKSFTVKITQPTIVATFANGVIKAAYSSAVTVSGGTANYTWKNSGTIPTGLKITYSGAKATLSGTPTKAGTYTFSLTATDKNKVAVTKSFTVKITQPAISATFANGVIKTAYSSTVTVSGGTANYTWKNSGTIPTGLKLTYSGAKATLSGTPTKAGTYTFTLTATDKNKAAVTKSFTVKITQPTIAATFANGVIKAAYSSAVTVSGGTAAYTWKNSGTIPTGLKITYSGAKATLSGTPTKAGTYKFTLTATDKNKAVATKSFTVKIMEAKTANKALPEVSPNAETLTGNTQTAAESKSSLPSAKTALPEEQPEISGNSTTNVTLSATLNVMSDDIAEAFDERDSDIVKVRKNMPARFIVSNLGAKVSEVVVYVDDNPVNDITVSGEGLFTLPAEIVSGDFKVSVKAQSEAGELESNELYIIAE